MTAAASQTTAWQAGLDGTDLQEGNEIGARVSLEETVSQLRPATSTSPYGSNTLALFDRFIDEPRTLKVIVIGGGLSGILAGILLPKKVPGIELVIYDKNADFGGTWAENVYPGVRCDIPSHVYQSTFEPKKGWTDQFSPGHEILDYWRDMSRKYNVYQYARFERRVEGCKWNNDTGKWTVTTKHVHSENSEEEEADFVISATGRFNAWKLPKYPGVSEYKGFLRHSSNYDPSFDPSGKRIAIIGNGASGIQLVANLQKLASRVDHYARRPTWVASSWAGDDRTLELQPITEEQKRRFDNDEEYLKFRKRLEDKYWRRFNTFFRGAENEGMRQQLKESMEKRLSKKPHLINQIVPDFSPNCRRLTPGPGYLEAVVADNLEYISTPIQRFTESGIQTVDGVQREVDAIFCATGANRDMVPEFPIEAHGHDLRNAWASEGEHGFPYTYLGVATPGFPNFGFLHGPHGTGASGTVPHSVETQLAFFAKVLRKVSREGIKSITPSSKAADDFVKYCDAFFSKTALSDDCSSWYNGGIPGGRIHGLWPGSAAHLAIVRREPRWEDWNYEYLSESGNRFWWYFGNGWTRRETDPASDMTPYLRKPEDVDLRDIHESWWSVP